MQSLNNDFRGHSLELVKSYYGSRNQCVNVNEERSNDKPIIAGVPQNSILGHFVLHIYLNNTVKTDPLEMFIIYGGKNRAFVFADNWYDLVNREKKSTLELLGAWAKQNPSKINATKTNTYVARVHEKCLS